MKIKINLHSLSTRLSAYILLIASILFVVSFSIYFSVTSRTITDDAFVRSTYQVENLVNKIDATLSNVELSVKNSVRYAQNNASRSDYLPKILENMLESNGSIVGASIAFEPYHFAGKEYYMCYTCRDANDNSVYVTDVIGDAKDYDYLAMDWYLIPKLREEGYWSEPYFDAGAGNVSMTTYTELLYNNKGEFIGVITADVSLDWISKMVGEERPYPNSYSFMLSRYGFYLSHDDGSKVLNETFFSATEHMKDEVVTTIGRDMLAMKAGYSAFDLVGDHKYAFYAPIKRVGWSVGIVSSQEDILAKFNDMSSYFWIIITFALILIFLFITIVIRHETRPLEQFTASTALIAKGDFNVEIPQIKSRDEMYDLREAFVNMQQSLKTYMEELHSTTKARERIESELEIATTIQMGMLPTIFPPHPNLPDVDLFATLIPAKEVGGDLYDFFVRKGKLYFTVGDASGKGVPASLLMAVTSSLFRSVAEHIDDPAKILYSINNSIAETNDANMFITLFVGELTLETGEMIYSSAGHNAPVLLRDGKSSFIDVEPALPLGAMEGIEYSNHTMMLNSSDTLLLYSDGLTEAENKEKELYSDERLLERMMAIPPQSNATTFIEEIKSSVDLFVMDNEQSDDLTMLVLKLKDKIEMKRELIIKNEISELNRLAEFIETLGDERGFDPALTMSLNLALEEAISNIILYAYPEKMGEEITVACVDVGGTLIFTISDSGVEFDPTCVEEADVTLSAEERGIGGLGIYLIRQIMDDVKYQRIENKNVLTIKKKL